MVEVILYPFLYVWISILNYDSYIRWPLIHVQEIRPSKFNLFTCVYSRRIYYNTVTFYIYIYIYVYIYMCVCVYVWCFKNFDIRWIKRSRNNDISKCNNWSNLVQKIPIFCKMWRNDLKFLVLRLQNILLKYLCVCVCVCHTHTNTYIYIGIKNTYINTRMDIYVYIYI